MPSLSSRPRLLLVRLPPWLSRRNRHPHDLMWPVALLNAQTLARAAGWHTQILDLHVEALTGPQLAARVVDFHPDVLVVDTMTPTLATALQLARAVAVRSPNTKRWAVGQHATACPGDLLAKSAFQRALSGEADVAIGNELALTSLSDATTSGPHGRLQLEDLDSLPPVDPRGLLLDRYGMQSTHVPQFGRPRWGFLLTSRGCPYRCTFCSPTLRQSFGRGFRGQSPDALVADMTRLHVDFGINAVYFIDDVMTYDRDRTMAFAEAMIAAQLPMQFVVQTRPDLIDLPMLTALKRAGCAAIKMGVESGSDRVLKRIRKGVRRDRIAQAARDVRAAGLNLTAYFMVGHPDETREDIEATIELAGEVDADMIQLAFHTPYPGSTAWETEGRKDADLSGLQHYESASGNASLVPTHELERLQRAFYFRYYGSPRVLGRYLRRRALYRCTDPQEWLLAWQSVRYLALRRWADEPSVAQTPVNGPDHDSKIAKAA